MKKAKPIKKGSSMGKSTIITPGSSLSMPPTSNFVHSFAAASRNSERTRAGKAIMEATLNQSDNNNSRRHKHRARKKRLKLAELTTVECDDAKGKEITNYHEKSKKRYLFISGTAEDNIRKNPFQNVGTTLSVNRFHIYNDDTFQGLNCVDKDGHLIFRLLPRAQALGRPACNLEHVIPAIKTLFNVSKNKLRGKDVVFAFDNVPSNDEGKYLWIGTAPNRAGVGLKTDYWPKGLDAKSKEHFVEMLDSTNIKASEYFESKTLVGFRDALNFIGTDYTFEGTNATNIWPSIAMGINTYACAHVDKDFFYSVSCVHTDDKDSMTKKGRNYDMNCPHSTHFMFPQRGIGVALRPGDVLIFNPQEL